MRRFPEGWVIRLRLQFSPRGGRTQSPLLKHETESQAARTVFTAEKVLLSVTPVPLPSLPLPLPPPLTHMHTPPTHTHSLVFSYGKRLGKGHGCVLHTLGVPLRFPTNQNLNTFTTQGSLPDARVRDRAWKRPRQRHQRTGN